VPTTINDVLPGPATTELTIGQWTCQFCGGQTSAHRERSNTALGFVALTGMARRNYSSGVLGG